MITDNDVGDIFGDAVDGKHDGSDPQNQVVSDKELEKAFPGRPGSETRKALNRMYPSSTTEHRRATASKPGDRYPQMRRQQERAKLERQAARAVTEETGWGAEERAADERRQQQLAARYPSSIPHYNARKRAEEAGN